MKTWLSYKECDEWTEIVKLVKPEQYQKMAYRLNNFTSDTGVTVTVEIYENGKYIILDGIRSKLAVWLNHQYKIARKPKVTGCLLEAMWGNGRL